MTRLEALEEKSEKVMFKAIESAPIINSLHDLMKLYVNAVILFEREI